MARQTALVAALATTLLLVGAAAGDPGTDKARLDARIGDLKAQAEQAAETEGVLTSELSALGYRVRDAERRSRPSRRGWTRSRPPSPSNAHGSPRSSRRSPRDRAARGARAAVRGRARGPRAAPRGHLRVRLARPDRLRARDDLVLRPARQPRAAEPDRAPGRADRLVTRPCARRARADEGGDGARAAGCRPVRGADRVPHRGSARDPGPDRREPRRAGRCGAREGRRPGDGAGGSCLVRRRGRGARGAERRARRADRRRPERAGGCVGRQRASARRSPGGQLGWPVAGPVTSGFGSRWGRMHEGIDIGGRDPARRSMPPPRARSSTPAGCRATGTSS